VIGMVVLFTSIFSGLGLSWDRQFGFLKETPAARPRFACWGSFAIAAGYRVQLAGHAGISAHHELPGDAHLLSLGRPTAGKPTRKCLGAIPATRPIDACYNLEANLFFKEALHGT
jgi:hypothetical protein